MESIIPDYSTKFINCPRCKNFITVEFGCCPNCRLEISDDQFRELFIIEDTIFRAVSEAENLKWLSFFCCYYSVISIFVFLMEAFVWFNIGLWVASVYFVYSFIRWQIKYGSVKTYSEEFLTALKDRRNSFIIFIFSLILGFGTEFLMNW